MNDFRRKLFSQEARREPSVLFDTAGLSGLYPFCDGEGPSQQLAAACSCAADAAEVTRYRADIDEQGNIPMQFDAGHLTAEGAIEVGRRLSVAFARRHARASDVSN
jgi:hypothetical protein